MNMNLILLFFLTAFDFDNTSQSIGLKPDNFLLLNSCQYQTPYLFSSFGGGAEENSEDKSWVVTEPLGGLAGGFLGAMAGAVVGMGYYSYGESENYYSLLGMAGLLLGGYIAGTGTGIWAVGKCIEKEDGNWFFAVLGSIAGCIVGALPLYFIKPTDNSTSSGERGMHFPFSFWGLRLVD